MFWTISLCWLSLCLPPDWAMLKRAITEYERKNIHPVWQAQHARLHKQISNKEKQLLDALRIDYAKQQRALAHWQTTPTTTDERDKILKKIKLIQQQLAPIQEKYTELLETFAQERAQLKPKWNADIQILIDQYNASIDNTTAPFFAKHNAGMYDDDDEFLLQSFEKESAAGGKED